MNKHGAVGVLSVEKNGNNTVKTTRKIHRRNTPGVVERMEIRRAEDIETDLYLRDMLEKRFGVPLY